MGDPLLARSVEEQVEEWLLTLHPAGGLFEPATCRYWEVKALLARLAEREQRIRALAQKWRDDAERMRTPSYQGELADVLDLDARVVEAFADQLDAALIDPPVTP